MILKNKKLNREIEIDFSFFREEYADVIKEAFDKFENHLCVYIYKDNLQNFIKQRTTNMINHNSWSFNLRFCLIIN